MFSLLSTSYQSLAPPRSCISTADLESAKPGPDSGNGSNLAHFLPVFPWDHLLLSCAFQTNLQKQKAKCKISCSFLGP